MPSPEGEGGNVRARSRLARSSSRTVRTERGNPFSFQDKVINKSWMLTAGWHSHLWNLSTIHLWNTLTHLHKKTRKHIWHTCQQLEKPPFQDLYFPQALITKRQKVSHSKWHFLTSCNKRISFSVSFSNTKKANEILFFDARSTETFLSVDNIKTSLQRQFLPEKAISKKSAHSMFCGFMWIMEKLFLERHSRWHFFLPHKWFTYCCKGKNS